MLRIGYTYTSNCLGALFAKAHLERPIYESRAFPRRKASRKPIRAGKEGKGQDTFPAT